MSNGINCLALADNGLTHGCEGLVLQLDGAWYITFLMLSTCQKLQSVHNAGKIGSMTNLIGHFSLLVLLVAHTASAKAYYPGHPYPRKYPF